MKFKHITFFQKHVFGAFFLLALLGGFLITSTYAASKTPAISSAEAEENLNAATILYQKNITKVAPAQTAFYEGLSRKNAAMLVKRFATNVLLKKDIKSTSECTYSDIVSFAPADQADIVSSCTLGIFRPASNFNPNYAFSRGQLVIVVARLISGNPNMELTDSYDYLLHLGIVKVDDRNESTKPALRKDLYIMLARVTVGISQVAAFSPFSNTPIGNINNGSTTIITTENNQARVLKIIAYKKDPIYNNYVALQLGSAVLVQNNKIITNAHVILDDEGKVADGFEVCRTITANAKPTCFGIATVDYYDEDRDLAVLSIANTAGLPLPVTMATTAPNNGEEVSVRGYPGIGGSSITLTKGIISGIEREKYKSDVKIDHGNSGGGAFNKRGELIGIPNSALQDTDTMSYIIPFTVVQGFLRKEGAIVTPPKTPTDNSFASYIKTLETQTNSTSINTPLFSLPSIGSFSFDSYNFDANRNLYSILLSSPDMSTAMMMRTETANNPSTQETGPAPTVSGKEFNIEDYCNNVQTGNKTLGNATWDYLRCDHIIGENTSLRGASTEITSGITLNARIQSESNATTQADAAEKLLNNINVKKNAQINNFNIYAAGPITLPKMSNLGVSYKMDEEGMIDLSAYLSNSSSDIHISLNFREISQTTANLLKNKTMKEFANYMDSFYESYYAIILSGVTVKNANNNVFYMIGYKDKTEDVQSGSIATREIDATTVVSYNGKTLRIVLEFMYDGEQNAALDSQIVSFLDQIKIDGTYPLKDTVSSLPSLTTLIYKP